MNPMSRRSLLASAAAALPVGALLAACGSDSGSESSGSAAGSASGTAAPAGTGAAEAPTGTLNFLNFAGWAGPSTYADFAAKFPGASVNEIAWASADDTVTKAKDRAGDIDLVLVDGTTFPRLVAIDAFAQLGSVPNMQYVAEQFKGNSWDPDDTLFAPTDHGRTGIIYRKDLVSTPPTSWADFIEMAPEYAGKVTVLDYNRSVMGNLLKMLGKPSSSIEQADIDEVLAVMLALKPSLLAISTEVGKQVAAGDAVMAMADAYDAQLALTTNPDVAWVDPSEGQVGYLEGLAILDGPRNDLATAFVDFFLEPTNYAAFINNVASPYVQPDNEGIDEVLRTSTVINPPADVVAKLEYHEFLGENQAMWDTAWDAFKAG